MPISLRSSSAVERNRCISSDVLRRRSLERLYQRRQAVEDLIRSLETYQRLRKGKCVEINVARKCS